MKSEKQIGIVSYAVYIPWHRLKREDIAKEWQSIGLGEKAVASYDENSLTMAVEAARNCLQGTSFQGKIESLYFCSTTPPYLEKQNSATIAEVLRLKQSVMTVDIANSLRAGTQGIILALDNLRACRAKVALVCASDSRLGLPGGNTELSFGDAAAAFCIGEDNVLAEVEGIYTMREEMLSTWRSDRDMHVRSYDERFGLEMGYKKAIPAAVEIALKNAGLKPSDFAKVVMYAANPRHIKALASKLGFDLNTQIQNSLFSEIGNAGTSQVPVNLVGSLEQSEPGDRILVVNYSDGCDVMTLRVTEHIKDARKKRNISYYLKNKKHVSYLKYLRWRDVLLVEPPQRPRLEVPSPSALWRDNKNLALIGAKCKVCNTVQYPAYRVCIECGTKDQLEEYGLADKIGKLVTFSHDNLAGGVAPATLAVVDFEDGGRIICDITDLEPEEIKVGMPIEMSFRVLRYVGGIYDYWWKGKPVRQ